MTSKVHEARQVEIRDLPLVRPGAAGVAAVALRLPNCGHRHTEDHPEIEGKVTLLWTRSVVRDSKHLTIRGAAAPAPLVMALDHAAGAGGRGGPSTRESRCRVLLITSSFYGISKEGAP
jgi:hypothetical protein